MRYIIFLTGLLCSCFGFGQSPCTIYAALISNGDCCADLEYFFSPTCNSSQVYADQLVIDLTTNPGFTGTFRDFTPSNDPIWADLQWSLNATSDIMTISFVNPSSTANLSTAFQTNPAITLGVACFLDTDEYGIFADITMGTSTTVVYNQLNETGGRCSEPGEWKKLYGTDEEETVNKVKAFGDGVYVAGRKKIDGTDFATFTKFNIADGSLQWEQYLDIESEFTDFDYNPVTDELIVVGTTLPFISAAGNAFDNQFVIAKWRPNGGGSEIKMYDHTGREVSPRIVVHKTPLDPNAPVYVVLGINADPATAPNSRDLTIVYNFRNDLEPKFIREYPESTGLELETHRSITDLSDGHILVVGTGQNLSGAVIKIAGDDLRWINSWYHQQDVNWSDVAELPNGNILLAGSDFSARKAVLEIVEPVNFTHLSGKEFPDVLVFKDISIDNNRVYTAARRTDAFVNIVYAIDVDANNNINPVWAKYLDGGATEVKDVSLFVSDQFDRIFYADARKSNPAGFGDFDLLVTSMDKEMENCSCVEEFGINTQNISINTVPFVCNDPIKMELDYEEVPALESTGECGDFCAPPINCEADFTYVAECNTVEVFGTNTGTGPFTYAWDFDCNGSVDVTGQNPRWAFPSSGTHCIRMIVTDADGVSCEVEKDVTPNCGPGEWKKLYGTDEEETVNKVKAFGDGVYVAGRKKMNGSDVATFSKFDISDGSLVWERFVEEEEAEFRDFDYNPATEEFIVVGRTLPLITGGVVQDNRFIIAKWTAAGVSTGTRMFDHNGRDGFEQQIVVHKSPSNPLAPIYVVTAKSIDPTAPPSSIDLTIAYNFFSDLTVNWFREYPNVTGTELETQRGIEDLSGGNILILGNGLSNAGTVLRINGSNGSFISPGYYHQGVIDWYDAVELPNGNILLSGTDFATDQALMMIVDPVNMNSLGGITFTNVNNFQEAWYNPADNTVYTVAREKAGIQRNVVYKLALNATFNTLSFNWARYLEEGETAFKDPHVFVSGAFDRLFYADSRSDHPNGFGDYDLLVASMDLEMQNCDCVEDFGVTSFGYTVPTTNVFVNANVLQELVAEELSVLESSGECVSFCAPPCSDSVDFTWTANCGIVELDAIPSGTGPYTYEWDIDCDDPSNPELTGQSAGYTFVVGGVYSICLKVTDIATGCVATAEQEVFIELAPPVITCPPSITISTDPGLCTATHQLAEPLVTDDCTTMFNITCDMSGATNGPAVSPVVLNPGVTDISCFTVDENNLWAECTYSITVVDNEAPVITCAPPISVTVPGCEGGAFPFIDDPVVTDNCEGVEWTTDHTLGDFFACGTRTVTFTATDRAGNQSTCNVPVTVNCQCAEVENPTVECTDVDDQLFFSVDVSDLAASDAGCTITVTTAQGGVALSNIVTTGTGPNYTVSGLIDLTAPPVPTNVRIVVNVNCRCFDGSQVNCSIPVNLPVPCCKEISVESQEVCKTGGPVQIPLLGCNTLYDVQQVRWFVADAPCTATTDFGAAFQVTNGCAPLNLSPQFHNGDVCVFAEVTMGAAAGACTVLRSDVATITLCEPLGCSLGASQAYCWSGGPITPSPLTLNLDTNECQDSIRWFDPQDNPIPSANDQLSYQPPALDFTLPATECAQSYTYRVEVSNQCGTQSCSATIRLDNENAPVGTLALLTPDVNPLCYGEDVVVEYTPECAGDPERWDWFSRPDKTLTYTPLTDNGDRNPLYYSNRLYEDTWVMVEKTNGACPADSIEVFLDIIDTLALTSFTAAYDDPCAPSFVDLRFGFTPNPAAPGSSYTVTWYRNGQVIQTTTNVTGGGDAINYSGLPPLFSLAGNYYATVENSRCPGLMRSPVITLDPPMEVYALGPCFRCKSETITLSSLIINPINGFTCTYQWYDNGTPIAGETGPDLIIDPYWSGPFTFEVTCTNGFITCIQSDVYDLRQCGPVDRCMPATAFAEFTERSIDINRLEDQVIINAVGLTSNFNLSVNFRDGSDEQGYTVDDLPIIYTYQTTVSEDPLVTLFEYDDAGLECNRFTTTATANPAAEAIGLKLYPNPNEGRFTLDFNLPQAGDFTIAIFDLAGRKVLTEHHWLGTGQQQLTLRSDHLPTGSYLLRMVGSDFTAAAKFQRVR